MFHIDEDCIDASNLAKHRNLISSHEFYGHERRDLAIENPSPEGVVDVEGFNRAHGGSCLISRSVLSENRNNIRLSIFTVIPFKFICYLDIVDSDNSGEFPTEKP